MEQRTLQTPAGLTPARALLAALVILVLLYAFICSINVMGGGLKVLAKAPNSGPVVQGLFKHASNPFAALFVGILVTSIVQSSSFTTSLTVGLVAAGQLDVTTAVPIVMGANIGTSVTNMLVSLGHMSVRLEFRRAFGAAIVHDIFNLLTVILLMPIELKTHFLARSAIWLSARLGRPAEHSEVSKGWLKAATEPIKHAVQHTLEAIGGLSLEWVGGLMAILGLVGLMLSLVLLVRALKGMVLARAEAFFARFFFRNWVTSITLGLICTIMVQSSSVTTSLIIPLVGAGILNLRQIFPYTVGANIGTTITSLLAALATASGPGMAIALAHVMFNVTGSCIFMPLKEIPIRLAEWYATLAATRRTLAIAYIVVIFFVVPIVCIICFG